MKYSTHLSMSDVDSMGLRYSNPRIFNHDEFISITLWRDSLNGVITYGKW